jgi:hypothetical protein
MARVELSPKAQQHLDTLVADRGADDYLLDRLAEQLEEIADRPATLTEPAKYPLPENRLMSLFFLNDAAARKWGFTISLRRTADEAGIVVLTINGAPYTE